MGELATNIIIGFLVGLASAYAYAIIVKWNKNNRKINWSTVTKGVMKLVDDVSNKSKPDYLIGLGRSGSIIGAMIAGNLGGVKFLSQIISREFINDGTRKEKETTFPDSIEFDKIKNSKVLLVVCNNITGGDLKEWLKKYNSTITANNIELELASLYQSRTALVKTDYHAFDADDRKIEIIHTRLPWMLSPSYKHSHK